MDKRSNGCSWPTGSIRRREAGACYLLVYQRHGRYGDKSDLADHTLGDTGFPERNSSELRMKPTLACPKSWAG